MCTLCREWVMLDEPPVPGNEVFHPGAETLPTREEVTLDAGNALKLTQGAGELPLVYAPVVIKETGGTVGGHDMAPPTQQFASLEEVPTQGEASFLSMYTGVLTQLGKQ